MFRSGQQVGLYTLIEKLGRGGFGEVWLAEKRSQFVTKKVAVKLPHEEQVNFDAIRQEATLWEQASGHPNVLPIIDADVYDEQVVIVSEYADGGSLADKLKREEKLSVKQAVEMTIGILNGLEFLHSRKIIHRDVKPQNILLQGNTPRLADFGISRAMNTTIVSSAIIGTDAYMSPESFDGKRNAQTDIWSVGVVLYQLLKGSLPFPQEHPSERMFAVLTKEFEPLPDEIPSDLRKIVQKALAKQPENRYESAEEMREDLQKALIGIAHPTFAKTEILHKPILPDLDTNALTLLTNDQTLQTNEPIIQADAPTIKHNFQTEETEVQTIVKKVPDNQPAPFYQQNSVVTEIKQKPLPIPAKSNGFMDVFLGKEIKDKSLVYASAAAVGLFLLIGIIFIVSRSNSSSDSHSSDTSDSHSSNSKATPDPYYVYTDLSAYRDGDKCGYKDSKGNINVLPKYDVCRDFREGFAEVQLNDKYGFINDKGIEVVPIKYDRVTGFYEGLASVKLNGKHGFVDGTGNVIIPFLYDNDALFSEGLSAVQKDGKTGYIDKTGKEIIPFIYSLANSFRDGLARVASDGGFGFIDKTGKEVIPLKYDYVDEFYTGLARVELSDKYGFIDKTGKVVIPIKYDEAGGFYGEGKSAEVTLNGRKYSIDKSGNEIDLGPANTTNTSH